jgi:hypothetical protein
MGYKSLSQKRVAGESAIASGIGVYASLTSEGGYNISGQSLTTTTSVTQTIVTPGQSSTASNVGAVVATITSISAANINYSAISGAIYATSYILVTGTGFVPTGYLTLNNTTLVGNVYYSDTQLRANLGATSNLSYTGNLNLAYYTPPVLIKTSNLYISSPPILYIAATGGNVTTNGNYKVHVFDGNTGSNIFTVTAIPDTGLANVEYLILAGGGGGGAKYSGYSGAGGGGGAGGILQGNVTVTAQAYAITIGAGGVGSGAWLGQPNTGQRGGQGANSTVFSFTVIGGGAGGGSSVSGTATGIDGASGGGGGGGCGTRSGGAGTPGYGFAGGNGGSSAAGGGGGGGGKGVGSCTLGAPNSRSACMPKDSGGTHGGYGILTCIQGLGANLAIAGGGGGGTPCCGGGNLAGGVIRGGGRYGGGQGSSNSQACFYCATRGTISKGAGGGGDARGTSGGAQGGSGMVIVKYRFQ